MQSLGLRQALVIMINNMLIKLRDQPPKLDELKKVNSTF